MQASSDIMLGWGRAVGEDGVANDYYIRQLWDAESSAHVELMPPRVRILPLRLHRP
jgi:hypothetical protein